MDPDAVWKLVVDESLPLDERAEAALNLLVWLAKGGALPNFTTAASIASMHAYFVGQCELILTKAIELIPGGTARMLAFVEQESGVSTVLAPPTLEDLQGEG